MIGCWKADDDKGQEVWKFNLQDRYGKFNIQFGMTSSPVLDGDQLYLQLIHGDGNAKTREAVVVCTGQEDWQGNLETGSAERRDCRERAILRLAGDLRGRHDQISAPRTERTSSWLTI